MLLANGRVIKRTGVHTIELYLISQNQALKDATTFYMGPDTVVPAPWDP